MTGIKILNKKVMTALPIAPALNFEEKSFVGAAMNIPAIAEPEAEALIIRAIVAAAFYLKFSLGERRELKLMAAKLISDLKIKFPNTTIKELEYAFINGARGDYGEFMGLSNATLHKWIKHYITDAYRLAALKKQSQWEQREKEKNKKTDAEKNEIMMRSFFKKYEEFKGNEKVDDIGNAVYDWLDGKNLIKFTKEEKEELMSMAEAELREEKIKNNQKNIFFDIKNIVSNIEKKQNTEIVIRAKKIALIFFLKRLIFNKIKPETLFE